MQQTGDDTQPEGQQNLRGEGNPRTLAGLLRLLFGCAHDDPRCPGDCQVTQEMTRPTSLIVEAESVSRNGRDEVIRGAAWGRGAVDDAAPCRDIPLPAASRAQLLDLPTPSSEVHDRGSGGGGVLD